MVKRMLQFGANVRATDAQTPYLQRERERERERDAKHLFSPS